MRVHARFFDFSFARLFLSPSQMETRGKRERVKHTMLSVMKRNASKYIINVRYEES